MPSNQIPIVSPTTLIEDKPDYVLILAWNFTKETTAQQQVYQANGGQFIVPVPVPQVVGAETCQNIVAM